MESENFYCEKCGINFYVEDLSGGLYGVVQQIRNAHNQASKDCEFDGDNVRIIKISVKKYART